MTKNELLERIREGIRTEETATSVYLGHLDAIVGRSGLSSERIEEIRKGIKHLVAENSRHKQVLEELAFKVENGDQHVY